jgi:hypothetical protein
VRRFIHHAAFVLPIAVLLASLVFRMLGNTAADQLLHAGLIGIGVTLLGRIACWLITPSRFAMWRMSVDANIAFYFGLGAMTDGRTSLAISAAGALLALLAGSFHFPPLANEQA